MLSGGIAFPNGKEVPTARATEASRWITRFPILQCRQRLAFGLVVRARGIGAAVTC
jgi:hypothetical protein